MTRPEFKPNATETRPDGTVIHPYLNAAAYSTARRQLQVGDQIWGLVITEKIVDEDGEVVIVTADGTVFELRLP